MTVGVIHAYSRTNAGDGLLVDLTLERLARAGVGVDDVVLVALDPESFPEVPRRVGCGTRGRGLSWELAPAAARAASLGLSRLTGLTVGVLAKQLARCDILVAVGGGYLRTPDATSSIGTALNHLPQLLVAAAPGRPAVYLPQSVGPLRGPVGRVVRRALQKIDVVCVRDGWSEREMDGVAGVRRLPDLAVLDLADNWDDVSQAAERSGSGAEAGRRVVFVARRVGHAGGYESQLQQVADDLGDQATWAVQTAGDRSKSDAVHYQRLGVEAGGTLGELLAAESAGVVVSVRLHGALMALRAGVPAVHLAYDRKGPAAFADLGLGEWCFDIRHLDPAVVSAAVKGLLADATSYWERVMSQVATLGDASVQLDALIDASLR